MPRPNRQRDVFAENHLAARITIEREQRGWTLESLAKRMTDVGCPIPSSAIYKIEQGQPRRRIVVDELVAFSRVFGIPVASLLVDPATIVNDRIVKLLERFRLEMQTYGDHAAGMRESGERLEALREKIGTLVETPDARAVLSARLADKGAPDSLLAYFTGKGGK